jgi:hypothetical protein
MREREERTSSKRGGWEAAGRPGRVVVGGRVRTKGQQAGRGKSRAPFVPRGRPAGSGAHVTCRIQAAQPSRDVRSR